MSRQLDLLLGQCYAAELLGKGKLHIAKSALRKQMPDGSPLRKEAQDRVKQLESVKDRCFVSKKHLEYIQYGLVQ